jgi:iron-sulfur cluster assembly protein
MIRVTDGARDKLAEIVADGSPPYVRFGLVGGGCNGFQYSMTLDDIKDEGDYEYPVDGGPTIIVDPMSHGYLDDLEIGYKKDLMGESFIFNNPVQKSKCGCGNSVSF